MIESRQVSQAINLFSMAAILSSFIGVGLGVFDYLADLFRFDNSRPGHQILGGDLPAPLALSPDVPVRLRGGHRLCRGRGDRLGLHHPGPAGEEVPGAGPGRGGVQGPGGQPMVVAVIVFGVLTAIFHLMAMAGLLPVYTG